MLCYGDPFCDSADACSAVALEAWRTLPATPCTHLTLMTGGSRMATSPWTKPFIRRRKWPEWAQQRYPDSYTEVLKHLNSSVRSVVYGYLCLRLAEEGRTWQRATADGRLDPNEQRRRGEAEFLRTAPTAARYLRWLA